MRKNLIYILILTMCISLFQIPAVIAADVSDYKESISMLESFGFLHKSFGSAKNKVNRQDFYTVVSNMINVESVDRLIESGIAKDDILTDYITVPEAEEILINALGYGDVKSLSGAFVDLKLTSGVSDFGILTSENMMIMLKNACETEIMQLEIKNGEYSLSTHDKETVLTKYHNIFKFKGVVKGIKGTSLSGKNVLYHDYMQVEDKIFATGGADVSNLLGREVILYYTENNKNDAEYVYAVLTNKNNVIRIEADDIVAEETTRTEFCYEDGDKTKKAKLSKVADMVYNNQGYPEFTADDLCPENGYVELIDNNKDGTYECVIVVDYRTIVVEKVSQNDEIITAKYTGEIINLNDYDVVTLTKNNEKSYLSNLKVWDVLFVLSDKYNEKIEIIVSDECVDGSLTSIKTDKFEASIDGKEYKINPELFNFNLSESVLDISDSRRFYLDPDGKIATIRIISSDKLYGYLFKSYEDTSDEGYYFTVFTQQGEWVNYKLSDKPKYNGEAGKAYGVFQSVTERQLIRYTLNANGEIKSVETAETVTKGSDSEKFRKMNVSGIYRIEDQGFSSKYYLGDDLAIFQIPTGMDEGGNSYADDKKNYRVAKTWKYGANANFSLEFYDPDKNNSADIIVYKTSPAVKSVSSSPVFMVSEVNAMTIQDEVVQKINGIVLGQTLSLTAENYGDFNNLRPGDALKFHMSDEGRIDYFEILARANEERVVTDIENMETYIVQGTAICYIDDIDEENGFIELRGNTGTRVMKTSGVNVSVYDSSRKKKVEKGTFSDIKSGDMAVVLINSCLVKDIIIYKE